MSRMRQLFRDAWAIARPYWFSEDRWAGRGLLVAVIAQASRNSSRIRLIGVSSTRV